MAHLKNVDPDDDLTIPYVKRFCEPPSTTSFIIRYNKFLHPTNYPPIHRYPRHDPPEDLSYLNYWERPTWFGGITGLLGFGYGLRQVQIWGWNSSTTRKKYPFTSSRMRTRTLMRYTLQWGCFGAWVGLVSVGIAHIRKRDEVANCNFAFLTTVILLMFFMKSFKRAATFAAASWRLVCSRITRCFLLRKGALHRCQNLINTAIRDLRRYTLSAFAICVHPFRAADSCFGTNRHPARRAGWENRRFPCEIVVLFVRNCRGFRAKLGLFSCDICVIFVRFLCEIIVVFVYVGVF
eukprot:1070068_1